MLFFVHQPAVPKLFENGKKSKERLFIRLIYVYQYISYASSQKQNSHFFIKNVKNCQKRVEILPGYRFSIDKFNTPFERGYQDEGMFKFENFAEIVFDLL